MVRRDPDSGKFVSGSGGVDWSETTAVEASYTSLIPAADLSGGTGQHNVDGEEAEIIDFSEVMANDEVFEVLGIQMSANLGLPTTATAEGSATFRFGLGSSSDRSVHGNSGPFYAGGFDVEQDSVDVQKSQNVDPGILLNGNLYAEPSHSDTTNGLAAGAAPANEQWVVSPEEALGASPVYDRDDELYLVHEIDVDNISDHAVRAAVLLTVHGRVEELD